MRQGYLGAKECRGSCGIGPSALSLPHARLSVVIDLIDQLRDPTQSGTESSLSVLASCHYLQYFNAHPASGQLSRRTTSDFRISSQTGVIPTSLAREGRSGISFRAKPLGGELQRQVRDENGPATRQRVPHQSGGRQFTYHRRGLEMSRPRRTQRSVSYLYHRQITQHRRGRMPKGMGGNDRHQSPLARKLDPGVDAWLLTGAPSRPGKIN